MRILHLLSQRPEATGSGIYVRAMIAAAAAKGHENFLLGGIPGDTRPEVPELPPDHCRFVRFAGADLAFEVVGMSDAMPYDSCRFIDLTDDQIRAYHAAFESSLQEAVAAFRPDLIHSHHLWLLTALARRLFPDLPLLTSCHGTDLRQFRHCHHLRPAVAAACRRLDAVLALSAVQRIEIAELYGIPQDRIHVVGAGYDPARFYPVPKPPPAPVRIVYAGKLSRTKGVAWLLRALKQIEDLPWQLELVGGGKGPEKEEVLDLAEDQGHRVTVAGLIDQAALAERMRRAHIFALPSFFEGLPLVLLEALACGCRLVVTDLPGVQELFAALADPALRLVPLPPLAGVDTPTASGGQDFQDRLAAALGDQVRAAAQQPDLDLSPFQSLLERYTWDGVFQRVAAVYAGCMRMPTV
ncbi:MAG: glycosyltransferase family 4 protein [Desulfobacteraceae bacterium]|jgi:glycosyltransferase involved in cell wall biosynthesis|nr:glycosyltransferase family 4 protein [Desulfobacteraceae bacterium]